MNKVEKKKEKMFSEKFRKNWGKWKISPLAGKCFFSNNVFKSYCSTGFLEEMFYTKKSLYVLVEICYGYWKDLTLN